MNVRKRAKFGTSATASMANVIGSIDTRLPGFFSPSGAG
jgi:hypothetical protein